jgi:hypothetical protein
MSVADELLDVAKYLLRQNNNRPTEAAIRRSISTAYYALFHRLIEAATAHLVPDPAHRPLVGRSFDHGPMKRVCQAVIAKSVPPPTAAVLGAVVPEELKDVARTFADLQDRRHDADYNLGRPFTRADARNLIADVQAAFESWRVVPESVAKPFVVLLLFGEPKAR